MSKKLSEQEKRARQDKRDAKAVKKELSPSIDKYGTKILRILREEAPEHPEVKYNSIYFEKKFEVSNITILRSISKLKKNHLIKENQVHGSYVIEEDFADFYSEETKKNLSIIASLGGLLQQYKNTPLYDSVLDLIYFLQPEIAKKDKVFSSGRVIVSPQMEFDIKLRNWDRVYEAIHKNLKIKFRYTKSYTNTKIQRIVWPYQLILENGSVYLWAYSEHADLNLMYDLNFMADIIITNEVFKLPKDYDINNYIAGGRLGAFAGDEVKKFKIRFTGYAKEWIKYHKWADDQTFNEDEESTTITFSSNQFEKVFQEVKKWGSQAQPLAPKALVKRWKDEIKEMYEMTKN